MPIPRTMRHHRIMTQMERNAKMAKGDPGK